jgi:lipopolysaccharide biosynthesis protein
MSATPPKTVRGALRRAKRILNRLRRIPGNVLVRVGGRLGASTIARRVERFPAGHHRWLGRRTMKLKADFPDPWRPVVSDRTASARVAVLVHVSDPTALSVLTRQISEFPVPVDVILTHDAGVTIESGQATTGSIGSTLVLPGIATGGHGLALASVVNAELLNPYDLVLRVWLRAPEISESLGFLLGPTSDVRAVLSLFAADPDLGIVDAAGEVTVPKPNGRVVRDLLLRLQLRGRGRLREQSLAPDFWARGFVLQGLRAMDLTAEDFVGKGARPSNSTTAALLQALPVLAAEAGYTRTRHSTGSIPADSAGWERFAPSYEVEPTAKVVPFYLPQFHTFGENDEWWGKGFTEWSNVAAAQPMYAGHNQPLLPGELGFYDLRNPTVTENQHNLAESMGVSSLMYYYYWFAGRKLLNRPIEDLLAGNASANFCIMWANENWTRRWDGSDQNILIGQDYEHVPTERFIEDVLPLLLDKRYLRVNGKPLVAVYRVTQIPDYVTVLDNWQKIARENGLPGLHLVSVDVGARMQGLEGVDPFDHGLDGVLEFAPHNMKWEAQSLDGLEVDARFNGRISSYDATVREAIAKLSEGIAAHRFPGVMVNFDNTARRQWHPDTWYGANPYTFRRWLRAAVRSVSDRAPDERLVFVNAWNEWAEGAVLEPSQRFGRSYLLAVRDVVRG